MLLVGPPGTDPVHNISIILETVLPVLTLLGIGAMIGSLLWGEKACGWRWRLAPSYC